MASWPEPASSWMKQPRPWTMFSGRCWSTSPRIPRTWSRAATSKKSWTLYSQIQGPHGKGTVISSWFALALGLVGCCSFAILAVVGCWTLTVWSPGLHVACETLGWFFFSPCHSDWRASFLQGFCVLVESCPCFIEIIRCGAPWGEESAALKCLVCMDPFGLPVLRQRCSAKRLAGVLSAMAPLPCDCPPEFTQAGKFCLLWMSNWGGLILCVTPSPLEEMGDTWVSSRSSTRAALAKLVGSGVTLSYQQML